MADADESGAVDPDELQKLIEDVLQCPCPPEKAEDIFKEYDLDGSNLLEALEFADLCAKVFEPSTDTFKGPLVAEKEKSPWVPPDSGILDIVFECPPSAASASASVSAAQRASRPPSATHPNARFGSAVASNHSRRPPLRAPRPLNTFNASNAWSVPMTPGTGPRTPRVAQFPTSRDAGGVGNTHR